MLFLILILLMITPPLSCTEEEKIAAKTLKAEDAPDIVSHFETEPSAFVCQVNAITGSYQEFSQDLVMPGPEPLVLQRVYCSSDHELGSLYHAWNINHGGFFDLSSSKESFGILHGPLGSLAALSGPKIPKHGPIPLRLDLKKMSKSLSNAFSGLPSGRTNKKNICLILDKENKQCSQMTGSGSVLYYKKRSKEDPEECFYPECYYLRWEQKPNGNRVHTSYDRYNRIKSISTTNKDGHVFASATFDYPAKKDFKHNPRIYVYASDGRHIIYNLKKSISNEGNTRYFLEKAVRPEGPDETYHYDKKISGVKYAVHQKDSPEGRYLMTKYYHKGTNKTVDGKFHVSDKYDPLYRRVQSQWAPAGQDRTPIEIARFVYHLNEKTPLGKINYTDVFNAHNHLTRYDYSTQLELTQITRFTKEKKTYRKERFFWGKEGAADQGNLLCRAIESPSGEVLCGKSYIYDATGNVLSETLFGKLTGKNDTSAVLDKNGQPIVNGVDRHTIYYQYSQDGKNLVLQEKHPNGKSVRYQYVPGTDLISARFTCDCDAIRIREFYSYDHNAVLVLSIRDDGTSLNPESLEGASMRLLTKITPKKEAPCLGLPEVVEEFAIDLQTGQSQLIKKITNTYDLHGKLLAQAHSGSDHALAYTLFWEYDAKGNIILEKNALGETITRQYDLNGNKIQECGPHPDYTKINRYDFSNRLIAEEEQLGNGVSFTITHRYDHLGNRIATIDSQGNETRFFYDEFSRLIKKELPAIAIGQGQVIPATHYSYDLLNYPAATKDPAGNSVYTACNIRGKPLVVIDQNGSKESYTYTIDGLVESKSDKCGNLTLFSYDFLGRLIKKEIFSKDHELLEKTEAVYNAFHLLSEIDPAGMETRYSYDPAGRMASKTCGAMQTTYLYDALGRQIEIREWLSPSTYQAQVKMYDLLGRVIEERIEDEMGTVYHKTSYCYDANGKKTLTLQETAAGLSVTAAEYNAKGDPLSVTDAEGNTTRISYNYFTKNTFGQYVLKTTTTDPQGNQTEVIYDALRRIVSESIQNPLGEKLQERHFSYDLNGNRTKAIETVFIPGELPKDFISIFEYNQDHQLIHHIEAFGTAKEKHTRWAYNEAGQKARHIKPDGVEILYTYDPKGRLQTFCSTDRSVSYRYRYHANGLPSEIEDLNTNTTTFRLYDEIGRLATEALGNDITMHYSYDNLGRPTLVTLSNQSQIAYTYKGPYLYQIIRQSPSGKVLYTHTYQEYDLAGNCTKEILIKGGGVLERTYDKLGRLLSTVSDQWQETGLQYDPLGNLVKRDLKDSLGEEVFSYTYDELSRLRSEEGGSAHSYIYDSANNRRQKDGFSNEINDQHLLISDSTDTYAYDANGNLILKEGNGNTIRYAYDALDRLVSAEINGRSIEFTYDAFNRRLTKKIWLEGGQFDILNFLYLGQNEIGAQVNGKLKQLKILGIGRGAEIGAAVAVELYKNTYIPIHDHQGSIASLLNTDGSVKETYRYTAFGEEELFDCAGQTPARPLSPWRFSSKRVDEETKLVCYGRRYYDPKTGRWTTPDPIGPESGPNPYAFVLNNPLTRLDLYGLSALADFGSFIGGVFGIIGSFLETASYEGIPCVVLKDLFMAAGKVIASDGLHDFVPSYREQHSEIGVIEGTDDPSQPIDLHVNGILTSLEETTNRCNEISRKFGGKKTYYVYNATHGFLSDILEWLGQRLGIPTNSTRQLTLEVKKLMTEHPGRPIRLWLHSQGGEIGACLRHVLTPEEQSLISVNAFGSANLFEKGHFSSVNHHVTTRDWVPLLGNPYQYLKACLGYRSNITFIKAIDNNYFDHSFEGKTYTKAFDKIASQLVVGKA